MKHDVEKFDKPCPICGKFFLKIIILIIITKNHNPKIIQKDALFSVSCSRYCERLTFELPLILTSKKSVVHGNWILHKVSYRRQLTFCKLFWTVTKYFFLVFIHALSSIYFQIHCPRFASIPSVKFFWMESSLLNSNLIKIPSFALISWWP